MLNHKKKLRVLLIEESHEDIEDIIFEIKKINNDFEYKKINSLLELKSELQKETWNAVISSNHLSGFTALTVLEVVESNHENLPLILLCDSAQEEAVADFMRAGVYDIVVRSRLERLQQVIRRVVDGYSVKVKSTLPVKASDSTFAAKEQMLAIASHDIKNPLSAIQLEAQMLLRAAERSGDSVLANEVKIQSKRMLKTTERLKNIISDLLDNSKSVDGLSRLKKSPVNGTTLVNEVIDSLRSLIDVKEILLKVSLDSESDLLIDRNKMFQVLSNLISNAIKFTPQKGQIDVFLEERFSEFVFTIDDTGPGLPDKEFTRVFEKYWAGNSGESCGTGLGLFICKTIVEAHGGDIFVENKPHGARFRFSLPKKVIYPYFDPISTFDLKNDSRKKIYIIDDDEDLLEVMSWALGKEGYAIYSFGSPFEALKCLEFGHHLPDLILIDYYLEGMTGNDFLRKKHNMNWARNCPVIMVSGAMTEVIETSCPSDSHQLITKPVDLEGLVSNIKKVFNEI